MVDGIIKKILFSKFANLYMHDPDLNNCYFNLTIKSHIHLNLLHFALTRIIPLQT